MKYQRVRRVMKEASRERERRRTCWEEREEREESSILGLRTQQTLGWLCSAAQCSLITAQVRILSEAKQTKLQFYFAEIRYC